MQDYISGNNSVKSHFMLKLIPPRPTFSENMTEEERNIMKQHVAYRKEKADEGIALVYGPVLDHKGEYGLGIIEVDTDDQARTYAADARQSNPALIRSKSNRCEQF